ncbi:hypothetical protein ACTXT7_001102 [Hymenolepis weldensis]
MAALPASPFRIFDSIPFAAQTFDWSLTFSTELHGFSLATLYRRCEEFASGDLEVNSRFEGVRNAEDFTEGALIMRHKNLCCTLQHQPSVLLIKGTTEHKNLMLPRSQFGIIFWKSSKFSSSSQK